MTRDTDTNDLRHLAIAMRDLGYIRWSKVAGVAADELADLRARLSVAEQATRRAEEDADRLARWVEAYVATHGPSYRPAFLDQHDEAVAARPVSPCPDCNGRGRRGEYTCDPCDGTGRAVAARSQPSQDAEASGEVAAMPSIPASAPTGYYSQPLNIDLAEEAAFEEQWTPRPAPKPVVDLCKALEESLKPGRFASPEGDNT